MIARPLLRLAFFCSLTLAACGGDDDGGMDGGAPDLGPVDTGSAGPDEDGDLWLDSEDNCRSTANPEQRDRDRDGLGDVCDPCPATPSATASCTAIEEQEPNDTPGSGEVLALPPSGAISAIRGRIEAPSGGQSLDRFQIMVPARTMARIRAARASPASRLEPIVLVQGGGYTTAREAQGLFVAERNFYFAAAGSYEVVVADRRGLREGDPRGSPDFAYELSVEVVEATTRDIVIPTLGETYRLMPVDDPLILSGELQPFVTTVISTQTNLGLGAATEGIDTIVVVDRPDGMVSENDDVAMDQIDSRVVLGRIDTAESVRIVIDPKRVLGSEPEPEVQVSVQQFNTEQELEPNDSPELASALEFPGQTGGRFEQKAAGEVRDLDWFRFEIATAGTLARFTGLLPADSMADPLLAVARVNGDGDAEILYLNTDDTGASPRVDALLWEAGSYYAVLLDQRNRGMPPYEGSLVHTYSIFAEQARLRTETQVVTSTTTVQAILSPGGRIVFHEVQVDAPTILLVETLIVARPELTPQYRVFGPDGVGLFGNGIDRAVAWLPAGDSYLLATQNANDGLGQPSFTYRASVELLPADGQAESEPNDELTEAEPVPAWPAARTGTLSPDGDVDRLQLSLEATDIVNFVLTQGAGGRTLNITDAAGGPVTTGAGEILGFTPPAAGTYVLQITGGETGPYVLTIY